jgi:hypothetical protein
MPMAQASSANRAKTTDLHQGEGQSALLHTVSNAVPCISNTDAG